MPFAPSVEYRGDAYLYGGIRDAGAALGEGLSKYAETFKRQQDAGKAADYFIKAAELPDGTNPILGQLRIHSEEWKTLGAKAKIAAVTGLVQQNAFQQAQAQHEEQLQAVAFRKQAMEANAQVGPATAEIAQATSVPEGEPQNYVDRNPPLGLSMQNALSAAMKKFPLAAGSPQFRNILETYAKLGGEQGAMMPVATKVGDRNLIVNPKTGAFQDVTQQSAPTLALGQELKVPGGGRWIGNGTATPHFAADADKTKALTEQQANALQFSERMSYNNAILLGLESSGFHPAAVGTKLRNLGPNLINTSEFQQYDAAKKNWISAVLRKESGAAISKSEESGADAQYFPRMGDSTQVVAQKAALRKLAETNMRRAVGDIPLDKAAPAARQSNQFESEEAARSAGAKAGDVIELYDPATATFRKARLK